MAKKLKAELELDTSRARQKAREVVETGGDAATGGAGISTAAERAAASLEKAADGAKDFGERAKTASSDMGRLGKVFAGMGIGLAQSIMANSGHSGGWIGNAAVGSVSAGMMGYSAAGKKGGAAAALASFGVSYFDSRMKETEEKIAKSRQSIANLESIKSWEDARNRTIEFRKTLESLTTVEDSLIERQHRLAEEIKRREDADIDIRIRMARASRDQDEFQRLQNLRNTNAAELDALNALVKRLDDTPATSAGSRLNHSAPDALSRVGGSFADSPGGSDLRSLLDTSREQLKVMKSIETKKERETAWQ